MTVNEAKKMVEDKYPNLKAAYAIPANGKFIFNMIDKKTGRIVFNSSLLSVDENTGEIESLSVINSDFEPVSADEVKKSIVYFCKEGMDMMNLKAV